MWLSKKLSGGGDGGAACLGQVTIGGDNTAVFTQGERRNLNVCAPGGYAWRPKAGDGVVVIKGGTGGEETFVVASEIENKNLNPGEVCIYTDGASIRLGRGGRVDINGQLYINGTKYVPYTGK